MQTTSKLIARLFGLPSKFSLQLFLPQAAIMATAQDGRLAGSYAPPVAIRVLRDLTRYRTKLVQHQSSIANRIQRLLKQCNVKLASVASDVLGVSALAMLRTLAAGETNPQRMADLAKRQLRKKIPALQLALEGCLLPHRRRLLADMLEELDHIGSKIARMEQAIEEQMRPYQKAVDAWMTVPGVKQRLAGGHSAQNAGQAASWRMKPQPGSLELFCFRGSCITLLSPGRRAVQHTLRTYTHSTRINAQGFWRSRLQWAWDAGQHRHQRPFKCLLS